jgi:hydroxyacylglutathione hydrolase
VRREVTVWGVGHKFTVLSVFYLILALVAHYVWFPFFVIQVVPHAVLVVIGLILMAIGIPIWVAASKAVDRAFEEGVLATQGVYALCRHPIYGNAFFFTIPGILLFFRSWLLLTVPVVMYIIFKLLIKEEEDYLRQEFGPAYLEYEKQVNAVFPKLWKLRRGFWYPVATGQVAENVYAVRVGDVNMFIYADGDHAIAVDAAYPGDALREEFQRLPITPQSVTHLFLTHGDVDHTGGLDLFPNAQVYLSRDEEQMVDGTIPRLFGFYHSPRIERAYTLLAGGDVISVGTIEVQAIATPGHTPGSLSYLVNDTVLFTGDTLTLQNGLVHTFYRLLDMDMATQGESIKKLARLQNVSLLCTAHTGCTTDWDRAMRHWREKGGTHPIPVRMSGG